MNEFGWPTGLIIAIVIVLGYLAACIRIIKEYERGVLFFFGRYVGIKEPGLRFILIPVFRVQIVELRTVVADVPSQEVITLDNVSCRVNAVLYFRVIHADKAILQVVDYLAATSQLAQTSLRSVVGANDLDTLLAEREKLNATLQSMLDEQTDPWGIKVTSVEIKDVEIPTDMRRAIARQAEAERERRAKVISALGESQAAEKLTEAAKMLATQPGTLQLRYLQTLVEVASENNSTTLFPIPLDFLEAFMSMAGRERPRPSGEERRAA